jgi:DNA recombination-dependent growth factor C
VNALAKVGNSLSNGSIGDASASAREIDADIAAALKALSINASASSAAGSVSAELSALLGALNNGDVAAAKKEYVDTVVALTDWAIKANVELKGV